MSTTKKSGLTALLALIGYFTIPMVAVLTPAARWDGDGPRFAETAFGSAMFWAMMTAFAIFVIAACVALASAIIRRVRRESPQT